MRSPRYPNLVQDLEITRPDQVWVADITYIRLRQDFVYLAVLMDVFTRNIRGWHLGRDLDQGLTLTALERALVVATPHIHHSPSFASDCASPPSLDLCQVEPRNRLVDQLHPGSYCVRLQPASCVDDLSKDWEKPLDEDANEDCAVSLPNFDTVPPWLMRRENQRRVLEIFLARPENHNHFSKYEALWKQRGAFLHDGSWLSYVRSPDEDWSAACPPYPKCWQTCIS